jgi:N-hydroxyarylamine O-acetyltransferase
MPEAEESFTMTELNHLFRKRIGLEENEEITFDKLESLLKKTAYSIPFENSAILSGNVTDLSKESLITKILKNKEGGLCYELNPLLCHFLTDNGFIANVVRGVVYNQQIQNWSETGRTHTVILLEHNQQSYLIDTGFGLNLPLIPVPLNGKIISTDNGYFKVSKIDHPDGDYLLEMRIKERDGDWKKGYVFNSKQIVDGPAELLEIQSIIRDHPGSSFNKGPLITRLTNNGYFTLTGSTFTHSENGRKAKEALDYKGFKELAKNLFGLFC